MDRKHFIILGSTVAALVGYYVLKNRTTTASTDVKPSVSKVTPKKASDSVVAKKESGSGSPATKKTSGSEMIKVPSAPTAAPASKSPNKSNTVFPKPLSKEDSRLHSVPKPIDLVKEFKKEEKKTGKKDDKTF